MQGSRAAARVGGQWDRTDPFLGLFLTTCVGERITEFDRTTKRELRERLRDVFAEGGGKSAGEPRDLVLDRAVSVRLPPALHDAAIRKASIRDTTVTDVIRNALRKDLGMRQTTAGSAAQGPANGSAV